MCLKVATLPTLLSQSIQKMKKTIEKQQDILTGEINMDTQTRFHVNGDINSYPCQWVDEQVTTGGSRRTRGSMLIEEDGTSFYHAYRPGGSCYETLYETLNGELKRTRKKIIVKLVLPLDIGKMSIIDSLVKQTRLIINFIRLKNERSLWV